MIGFSGVKTCYGFVKIRTCQNAVQKSCRVLIVVELVLMVAQSDETDAELLLIERLSNAKTIIIKESAMNKKLHLTIIDTSSCLRSIIGNRETTRAGLIQNGNPGIDWVVILSHRLSIADVKSRPSISSSEHHLPSIGIRVKFSGIVDFGRLKKVDDLFTNYVRDVNRANEPLNCTFGFLNNRVIWE